MNKICCIIFCFYLPLFAAGFSEHTVTYFTDSTIALKATLFVPDSGQGLPALIMIHEGGFTAGSRHCFAQYGDRFTRLGYAVMSIDYRLVQEGGTWPRPLEDCLEAVAWLKANSGKYRIDKTRIILVGSSAGAYLATMIGLAPGLAPEITKNRDVQVRGVVSSFGVYDWAESNWQDETFLPAAQEKAASPVRYARHAQCPFLVLAGERDHLFNPQGAQAFADSLKRYGHSAEVRVKPRQDHEGLCNPNSPLAQWALPLIEDFLKRTLGR